MQQWFNDGKCSLLLGLAFKLEIKGFSLAGLIKGKSIP